ncbi:MAG: hypothetical protein KDC87_11680, partial [Planctomycetes bacterium]|nr:hypothetical protein [Planctomycetota bacterium]
MRIASLLLVSLLTLGSTAVAQQNIKWYPDNTTTGSGNAFPFGSAGIRYQTIVPRANFGTNIAGTIKDIMVNAGTYPNTEIAYDDIEIRMGVTTQATPVTDWSTNNPNPTTVYRGKLRIRFQTGTWTAIGLPNSYTYVLPTASDNLCIEVICWAIQGRTAPSNFYYPLASSSANRAFRYNWINSQTTAPLTGTSGCKMGLVVDSGSVAFAGTGCQSSSSTPLTISTDTYPSAGNPITVSLRGAKASSPAMIILGINHQKWGGIDLPFAFFSSTCLIWNDVLIQGALATDAAGSIDLKVTVPTSATSGTLFAHFWVADA